MDMLRSVDTFEQGDNVRVLQFPQDIDLGVEILSQLSRQLSRND